MPADDSPTRQTNVPHESAGWLWTESAEQRVGPVATVAPVGPIDKLYSFAVPESLADQIQVGQRLLVPLGRSKAPVEAFCLAIEHGAWSNTLKEIQGIAEDRVYLSPRLVELGRWISRYYACPLGRALAAMTPPAVRKKSGSREVKWIELTVPIESLAEDVAGKMGKKQRALLEHLGRIGRPIAYREAPSEVRVSPQTLGALERKGWIRVTVRREAKPAPEFTRRQVEPEFELNEHQTAALRRIEQLIGARQFRAALLLGVSGSGKTEVYVRAIRKALAMDRQAIVLVPEIALTEQIVRRLAERFESVAVLHSGMTDLQRSLLWAEIEQGRRRVVIGTRSAVFAPCPGLGLIIVDEEQEATYKNQQSPRYVTRDVAVKRGQIESVPVILGSATPSMETWNNARRLDHFELIRLPHRVGGLPLPKVWLVDMREEQKVRRGLHLLSRLMETRLAETLQRRRQAVLLINRRGYATFVFCPSCGRKIVCPNCRVNMVFHLSLGKALCHYCRFRFALPKQCQNEACGRRLIQFGAGTQRVEEEVRRLFPQARLERVDSDTMLNVAAYERIIQAFERQELDILVGTQIVAKGLDFPCVSFVGVISADTALGMPDFRAAERTFQLITQVAGRAGRSTDDGGVVVQTLAPELPALQAAMAHDFDSFARDEMAAREKLFLPPFARLARIILADPSESRARAQAELMAGNLADAVQSGHPGVRIDRPQPCVLSRLQNLSRFEILLRAPSAGVLQAFLDVPRSEGKLKASVRSFTVDVDPVDLM